MVRGIFKIALRLRDRHVFKWQSVKILKFSILYVWNRFSGKQKLFSKTGVQYFYLKALTLKTHHFHTKLSNQKQMLWQIKWWLQNRPITKNGVFPVTTLLFWKFYFNLITSYKELIYCINNPIAHICTFCKPWSFIWRCLFPVSILKLNHMNNLE